MNPENNPAAPYENDPAVAAYEERSRREAKLAELSLRLQVLRYRRSADRRQRALIDLRVEAYDRQISELELEREVIVREEAAK